MPGYISVSGKEILTTNCCTLCCKYNLVTSETIHYPHSFPDLVQQTTVPTTWLSDGTIIQLANVL